MRPSPPSPRWSRPLLAVALLVLVAASPAAAATGVAVLDFESVGAEAGEADPWSFGLADFLSAAVEERGLPVYERRALRAVLAERSLNDSGFVADPKAVAQALPTLRFLVGGRIEALAGERFRLALSALDTRNGRVAVELSAEGRYPEELAAVLEDAADRLVEGLAARMRRGTEPSPAEPQGFTRNPDVAVQFYKGIDHLVHGRPEFAAEYFRQAELADPTFFVAAAWRMRAYEALGLDDLAHYVRGTLLADLRGRQVFQLVAPSVAHERGGLVVAVPRSEATSPAQRELLDRVATSLLAQPGIELFSAGWIRSLADELDVRLSGQMPPYALESQAWLAADLVVRSEPAAEPGVVRVDLVDALSGARVARVELAAGDDPAESVPALLGQLAGARRPGGGFEAFRLRELRPLDYALPEGDIGIYTRVGYAYLLRDFADHPTDPARIASHANVHHHNSYAKRQPDIYDHEWGYTELLWQRVLKVAKTERADAANWLSLALWKLRLHGNDNGDGDSPNWWYNRGKRVPTIAEHFAPLLRRHPDSLAALCVRYSLALEHAMWGRHQKAAEILIELAERPHAEGELELDYRTTANLFAMASIEARRIGRGRLADDYAERALLHAERFTHFRTPANFARERPINGHDHPVEPVIPGILYTPPGRGGHAQGHWYVGAMAKTVFLDRRVRFMREEPMNGEIAKLAGASAPGAEEVPIGLHYRAALELSGAAGIASRFTYLRRLTREIERGTPVSMSAYYGRPLDTLFPWLHERVAGKERAAFEGIVADLVAAERARGYLEDRLTLLLYAAAGMDDDVLEVAERGLRGKHSGDRGRGAIAKSGVLARRKGPRVAARYLAGELARFERDFTARGMNYLDLVHACGQAFEAAGDLATASGVYRDGLAAPLFESAGDDPRRADHHRASLRYRRAALEAQRGNAFEASQLLKQVIEGSEAHPDWLIHYTGHQARTAGTLTLYRAAVRDLAALRSPAASR